MQELEPYGIVPLTGESDQHMYRILCDLTAKGKAIIDRTASAIVTIFRRWFSPWRLPESKKRKYRSQYHRKRCTIAGVQSGSNSP
jgi:hypothetical protein